VKRAVLALLLIACSTRSSRVPVDLPTAARPPGDADRTIRVALAADAPRLSASGNFAWYGTDGRTVLVRASRGIEFRVEPTPDGQLRAVTSGGLTAGPSRDLVLRSSDNGFVTVNGRRYRGELLITAGTPAVTIVNRLPLEEYLRSVVAVEMGNRPRGDSSALQAQAVASRSYAYVRLASQGDFDIRATVADQAYGGVDVENQNATAAVDVTRGLVVRYQDRVVGALYFSTCGGSTAEPTEVWRTSNVAYFKRVSDRIGRSDRYYCDGAPRFKWNRTLAKSQLDAALATYLKNYAVVPEGGPGSARHVAVLNNTPSGRVAAVEIETDRGAFSVRGDDIRYVFRPPGGEILSSTYFSVAPEYGRDGVLSSLTFLGRGNGHGVGMCQWGAIGRARAGQSFRTILATYYPGTTVGYPVE
jgi:stage II sporulation protein D